MCVCVCVRVCVCVCVCVCCQCVLAIGEKNAGMNIEASPSTKCGSLRVVKVFDKSVLTRVLRPVLV